MGKKNGSFEPFAVEKWPLVQAFALEGTGGYFKCCSLYVFGLIELHV